MADLMWPLWLGSRAQAATFTLTCQQLWREIQVHMHASGIETVLHKLATGGLVADGNQQLVVICQA